MGTLVVVGCKDGQVSLCSVCGCELMQLCCKSLAKANHVLCLFRQKCPYLEAQPVLAPWGWLDYFIVEALSCA